MQGSNILKKSLVAFGLTTALFGIACSSLIQSASPFSEQQARCELRPAKMQCTDIRKFVGPSLVTFQGVCSTLTSALKDAGGYTEKATCDTKDMLGGCQSKSADGSLQTNWYYKGGNYATVDDAKKECDSSQTWVDPQ